jgi:hypothetical protein
MNQLERMLKAAMERSGDITMPTGKTRWEDCLQVVYGTVYLYYNDSAGSTRVVCEPELLCIEDKREAEWPDLFSGWNGKLVVRMADGRMEEQR